MPACRLRTTGLLEITGRDDLHAGPRDQAGQDAEVHADFQEMHGAVREHGVGPAGVEGIDLPVVGAVDSTRARLHRSVSARTLQDDRTLEVVPRAALQRLVRAHRLPRLPEPWPARIFGEQDGVRGAV